MIYIDTETTGVKADDEILSITVLSSRGEIWLNTFLTPSVKKTWDNVSLHGITPEFIFNGNHPKPEDLQKQISAILQADEAVFYGRDFDGPMMERTWDTGTLLEDAHCCLERYAAFKGEPSSKPYHKNGYRSWKLIEAAEQTGHVWKHKPHTSIGDTFALFHVWNWLDKYAPLPEE